MRIGIDARFLGPLGKGLGRYTSELIRSLECLDTENEYVIFLRRENFGTYHPKNCRFRKVLADFRWYSFEEQFYFPIVLYRERCDLVHFPHFNVPILYRRPFVVTIHDLILLRFPTKRATTLGVFLYRIKFLAYSLVIRNALRSARRIITVSEYTKQDILSQNPGIRPEKILVTYEAAHPFCFLVRRNESHEYFRSAGLLHNDGGHDILRPYALYVGNAYPHKNLERLITVFSEFPDREARLVLIGKEDYFYARLKRYAAQRNVQTVVFPGFVPDSVLDEFYLRARCYVFPSLYEGFGLPPLEAMAKGVPVIAANTSCLPEILGDAALFFDAEDSVSLHESLVRMWSDPVLQETFRQRGYRRVSEFSWEILGKETLQVYQEAIRNKYK